MALGVMMLRNLYVDANCLNTGLTDQRKVRKQLDDSKKQYKNSLSMSPYVPEGDEMSRYALICL
jgi:hypothetical protein